ncbi:polysaccharide pyruvyl transferase family protein [Agromyces marinus]|uniref:Polysaccharide pyruvyl transferase domain-containing protein n=1 Tax=Agromyces marinus TaxID=1389020 RepID=A0ABN6YAU2_9MICO|nr:polysaccharide pyruvyl transferase family protein [Agromyces marinus]UIP57406.1 hypothetical protein DSM26151_02610 [Agromyces marinus]BDZ54477.1 hypothetical protein GCM10025870_15500 [Agromyces marinus]
MRVVVIGDVGVVGGMMHVGDEAMFDAMVEALRARGVERIVGISNAPAETADRYGIEAIGGLAFPGSREDLSIRSAAVLAAADGRATIAADDPALAVIEAVASADGVVVAGGGNLTSNWPHRIFERTILGTLAERFGTPLVVSGQTLGPRLDPVDRATVGALLRSARLVGVREHPSAGVAADLGVPTGRLAANRDDATFLGADEHEPADGAADLLLVSLSVHLGGLPRGATISGLARSIDALADRTGLEPAFHPHFGSLVPGTLAGDQVLHDAVRTELRSPSVVLPTGDPRSAARLARGAGMLVTSRYHPAVFAGPAGVPIAALPVDSYTGVKLRGATGWWAQDGVIDLATAWTPAGGDALARVWASRETVRASADRDRRAARAAMSAWFNRVAGEIAR